MRTEKFRQWKDFDKYIYLPTPMDCATLHYAPIDHIALHTELDAECDLQAISVGRYLKHIATQHRPSAKVVTLRQHEKQR